MNNILVRFDGNGAFSLTVYLDDLNFDEQQNKHAENFDERMRDLAVEKMKQENVSIPLEYTYYEVEPY